MSTLKNRQSAKNKQSAKINALKHGVFAVVAILPGEDVREFEALHNSLIAELQPEGTMEHDCVLTIAKARWRKDRLQKFLAAKAEGCTYDPNNPLFQESRSLYQFFFNVTRAPEEFDRLLNCLSGKHADHLRQNFSPENFKSIPEWTEALRKEIFVVLLPKADPGDPPVFPSLYQSAQILPPDAFANEVALDDRLDGMIDRAFRRLVQIKTAKELLGRTSQIGGDAPSKKIP
jgi:hypothetical protein